MRGSMSTAAVLWLLLAVVILFVALEAIALVVETTLGPARPLFGLLVLALVGYYLLD